MKKKVLFIDEDPGRAGSTVSMEYLVRGFSERSFDVYVLTSKKDDSVKVELAKYAKLIQMQNDTLALNLYFTNKQSIFSLSGLHELYKDFIKFIKGLFIFYKFIKPLKPDLIYLNEYTVIQASIIASYLKIPSVVHIRSFLIGGNFGIRRYITSKMIIGLNKKVFPITELEMKQLNASVTQLKKIVVVPEFFPVSYGVSKNIKEIRSQFRIPEKKIVISMLGGILDIKGSIYFLKAAIEVTKKYPEALFILAGKHFSFGKHGLEYYNQCLKLIEILKENRSIMVLGEIKNSLELIRASDIIVSASIETHFARPVIEAWGFEKPVVVAKSEHALCFLIDNENGLLYQTSDYLALADRLIELINSEALRARLGAKGKEKVMEKFDAEKNIQTIVNHCSSLIQ